MDVVYALKRQGRTIYGFGGWVDLIHFFDMSTFLFCYFCFFATFSHSYLSLFWLNICLI
jgi:hypothetical protein